MGLMKTFLCLILCCAAVPIVSATGYVSGRVDVPSDHVAPWRVPIPGSVKTYTREAMSAKEPLVTLLREALPR